MQTNKHVLMFAILQEMQIVHDSEAVERRAQHLCLSSQRLQG